jgi:dihydrofolate synthase/folylpolyglutamate synthase
VLIGMMGDKNVDLILERLAPITKGLIATSVGGGRSIPARDLAQRATAMLSGVPVLASDEVEDGLDMARAEAGPQGAVLVTGSLYLVGEVRSLLR